MKISGTAKVVRPQPDVGLSGLRPLSNSTQKPGNAPGYATVILK